ncbi:MAG TPA: rhomboid family intramembrane serine protease [Verrucomicrobiae bacterium]|nr:rhomboid family intramembrane serine protease [Verrucomicrobiae bacterium]
MSQRYFIYPILFIALMQLVPLLRDDRRWHAAQIGQLGVILLACLGGLCFSYNPSFREYDRVWVIVSAALFVIFVAIPPALVSAATGREQRGRWPGSARFWQLASWFTWGQTGRLYRRHGAALRLMARGECDEALGALELLIPAELKPGRRPMPPSMFGLVHLWKLSLLITLRRWRQALEFYESVYDWGMLGLATQARLLAARALAETGQFERALRSLQLALLSPRTVGTRQTQLWATRVAVTALAGDRETLYELLNHSEFATHGRRFARFAAYWRGQCALARGEREDALRMLTQASGLTHRGNRLWCEAIGEQLQRAEREQTPVIWAAQDPAYVRGQELLRRAEKDSAGWRTLMHMGRPELVTLLLLLAMATMHLVFDAFLSEDMQEKVLIWAGNSAETIKNGEWWRAFTALFLHANLLHLGLNGLGLWLFGPAVEKTMGRWRMLVVFLVGGALGNLASASVAHYDVAIGASGGIFAVIGAFAVGVWRLQSPMYSALRRRLLFALVLMVAADFTIGGLEPQVDNLAHVGGFFAGILLAMVLGSTTPGENSRAAG